MNLISILITLLKPVLYPLSILYGAIVWMRNKLYDAGVLASIEFSVPVICVGNLSTGGTGKTPHIEYLIQLLQYEYRIATMSRGYKRRTTGFYLAGNETDATIIGDEPMQFFTKFPELAVSVCEDRMTGIPRLLSERPSVEVVLLDDAFQHRSVKPGLNILIMDINKPFYKDYILPFGSLRESRKAYKRADVIIVSKCPDNLSEEQQVEIVKQIAPAANQRVYFSAIKYQAIHDFFTNEIIDFRERPNIVLVTGIAKPESMLEYLRTTANDVHLLKYPDHHYFTEANREEMRQTFLSWDAGNKIIVTTEKDATRLALFKEELRNWNIPIGVLPIGISFLKSGNEFDASVRNYIDKERDAMMEYQIK